MATKLVRKQTLNLPNLVDSMNQYLDQKIHISKILNKISVNDIPHLTLYLQSLLKFNSLFLTQNKITDKDQINKLIRPAYYLLLTLVLFEKIGFQMKTSQSFLDKIKVFFTSYKNGKRNEDFSTSFPSFLNYEHLLPSDMITIHSFEGSINKHVITFLNLSFYSKNNTILFFEDKISLDDILPNSYNKKINKFNYYGKSENNKYGY